MFILWLLWFRQKKKPTFLSVVRFVVNTGYGIFLVFRQTVSNVCNKINTSVIHYTFHNKILETELRFDSDILFVEAHVAADRTILLCKVLTRYLFSS